MEAWASKAANAPLFKGVPESEVTRLLATARSRQYHDREIIFDRGDDADYAYIVTRGRVRISTLGANTKRVIVQIFQELDIFGELGIIDKVKRNAEATALGATELAALPAGPFRELLDGSPVFAVSLLRLMTARLRRTYSLLEDASLLNLENRLARQVLYLMSLGASGEERIRIHSRMRQEDLADLLGATSRSIITILNKWRSEGLADFDGRTAQLTILDIDGFKALTDDTLGKDG